MVRGIGRLLGAAVLLTVFHTACLAQERSLKELSAQAAAFYEAAGQVSEPASRGRLFFLVQQRLERIRRDFPQSPAAAQLAFGRYGGIDARLVEREANAWLNAHPGEAASLASKEETPAPAVSGILPSFGGGVPRSSRALLPSFAPDAAGGGAQASAERLAPTELVRLMREAIVIIYDPAEGGIGTGFFISPRHLLTNTHVVARSDRVVAANRTLGVRSAHVLFRGMSSDGTGIDTAILETDGWENPDFLAFAERVEEGEAIAIGGYPGRASGSDKAFDQFLRLIRENNLPTTEAVPNVKFDFGYVQSIFTDKDTGIENVQNGVNTSGGNSGSPILNRCGAVVAQHYSGSNAFLTLARQGETIQAVGDTSKFNYAISGKELTRFLAAARIPFARAPGTCPQSGAD